MSNSPTLNENSIVCRTCLNIQGNKSFVSIEAEHEHSNIALMLQSLMPEIDIYVSANPVICSACFKSLVQMNNFKKQCLTIENSIKNYLSRNNMQHFNNVNLVGVLKGGIDSNISTSDRENALLSEDKDEALDDGYTTSHNGVRDTYADANIKEVVIEQNLNSETEPDNKIFEIFPDFNDSHALNESSQTLLNTKTIAENRQSNKLQPKLLLPNLQAAERNFTSLSPSNNHSIELEVNIRKLQNVAGNTPNKYNICSFSSERMAGKFVHNRNIHSSEYTCKYCQYITPKIELLRQHMKFAHTDAMVKPSPSSHLGFTITAIYFCILCPFSSKSYESFRIHRVTAHPTSGSIFQEPMRSQFAPSKSRIVVKLLEFCCTSCPYSTRNKSDLNRHLLKHRIDKKVECGKCGRKYATNLLLRWHMKNPKFCDPYLKTYEKRNSKNL